MKTTTNMKTKSSKQPKKSKPRAELRDMTSKQTPKGGATRPQIYGSDFQHNETLVRDEGR